MSFFVSNIDGESGRPNKIRLESLSSTLDEADGIADLRDGKAVEVECGGRDIDACLA